MQLIVGSVRLEGACLHVKGWQLCGGGVAQDEVGRAIVLGV